MVAGCIETFDWDFFKIMWKRSERPEIEKTIKGFENKIIRLKTRREMNNFLETVYNK